MTAPTLSDEGTLLLFVPTEELELKSIVTVNKTSKTTELKTPEEDS